MRKKTFTEILQKLIQKTLQTTWATTNKYEKKFYMTAINYLAESSLSGGNKLFTAVGKYVEIYQSACANNSCNIKKIKYGAHFSSLAEIRTQSLLLSAQI